MSVRAVVTDIEGTTSSIAFVHEVLFPYAARELPDFLRARAADPPVAALIDDVRAEIGEADADTARVVEVLLEWIAEDRKATPLKELQGLIWAAGYERRDYTGHVYPDAAENLRRWSAAGIAVYIYSSGSIRAQELLFGHADCGDLRPLIRGYFDTRTGAKREVDSYRRIAAEVGLPPPDILFLSDVVEELDAAASAGMLTTQVLRDDTAETGAHRVVHDFDSVLI
ncbi:MAG: acireductone synthase [Woeseiaceae bacterium]